MKKTRKKVTAHVIDHSNADSATHKSDKVRNDELLVQKAKSKELEENVVKTTELILLRSSLDAKYKSNVCPNLFLVSNGPALSPASGDAYAAFQKAESKKRTHYRSNSYSKPNKIAKDSSLNICTFTLLPAHSVYVRTLPVEAQIQFILDLARKRAGQLEVMTGWKVLGIAVHNDTDIIHFDLMITRYSEPRPLLPGTRQRVAACELLGDRRGIRAVGPCVTGLFRLSAEGHLECARPGLQEDAVYKWRAHRREYAGETPIDLRIALAIDKDVRAKFGGVPEFEAIRIEWYQWQAQIMRERSLKTALDLVANECADHEKVPAAGNALHELLTSFAADGIVGVAAAYSKLDSNITQVWLDRVAALTDQNNALSSRLAAVQEKQVQLKAALETSQHDHAIAATKNSALEMRLEQLTQDCAMSEDLNHELESANAKLVMHLEHANKRKKDLVTSVEKLQLSLVAEAMAKAKEIDDLQAALTKANSQNKQVKGERDNLWARLQNATDVVADHRQRITADVVRIEALERRVAEAEHAASILHSDSKQTAQRCSVLEAQAVVARKRIETLTNRNAFLEQKTMDDAKQANTMRELEEKVVSLTAQKNSMPAELQDRPKVYLFLDVRTGQPVDFGSWTDLESRKNEYSQYLGFMVATDITMLSNLQLVSLLADPAACWQKIDAELATIGNVPELPALLAGRFPDLADMVESTIDHLKGFAFSELQRVDRAHRQGNSMEEGALSPCH